ncbi:MAG TPA: hypothetical protein PKY56_10285, partial [Candidatus Kapabacteria bacterium]|nr:hypothetical protein [Candidatus Kapabacteria bacterium]
MLSLVEKLVLSLNKREKSYFKKINESQNLDNLSTNYLTLYNHITKNKRIDKKKLILQKKKIMSNLSKEKEILVQKILISLFTLHNDDSIFNKIIKCILFTKFLIGKGINENTLKYLIKAKNYAYQNEEFTLILVIIDLEQHLCFNHCFIKDYDKFNELEEERFKIIDIINNLNSLIKIKTEIQQFQFNENCYSFDINYFIEKYGHSPLVSENEIKSIKAKSIWYYIMFFYYFIKHDYQLAYDFINMQYELFKKHPKCFEKDNYLQLYGNLLYTCALLNKVDTFNSIMQEFRNLKCNSMQDDIYVKRTYYFRTLELYHNLKRYQEASNLAIEAEIFINRNKKYSENQHNSYLYVLVIR